MTFLQAKERQRSGWSQWNQGGGSGSRRGAARGRAAILEPFIQERCAAAAEMVAAALQEQLAALPPPTDGQPGAATIEQALLLGESHIAGSMLFPVFKENDQAANALMDLMRSWMGLLLPGIAYGKLCLPLSDGAEMHICKRSTQEPGSSRFACLSQSFSSRLTVSCDMQGVSVRSLQHQTHFCRLCWDHLRPGVVPSAAAAPSLHQALSTLQRMREAALVHCKTSSGASCLFVSAVGYKHGANISEVSEVRQARCLL